MYMRLTFNVTGDDFDAELALKETSINNMVVTFDVNYSNYIQFNSDREFSHEYYDEEYESIFYNFISNNIDNFLKNGADDFSLFMEVYVSEDEQCNFEILNADFLSLIGQYRISIPLSIYKVVEL